MKEQWSKLTDDHLDVIAGKREQLVGQIRENCGVAKADAKVDIEAGYAKRSASEQISVARQDAAEDKRDANYAAKERCDKYAGDVKDRSLADAKARFGVQ